MGMPLEMQWHQKLKHQVDNLDFMLYDRQQEFGQCSCLRQPQPCHCSQEGPDPHHPRQGAPITSPSAWKNYCIIDRLHKKVATLEKTIREQEIQLEEKEEEGEDIRGDLYSYLSDDDDYLEDDAMEFHTDDDDSDFIDDD